MGIPEIFIGYRDERFVLRRTALVPTDSFSPPTDELSAAYNKLHTVLQTLRDMCASRAAQVAEHDDAIWTATVKKGYVQQLRLLDNAETKKPRAQFKGARLGVLPADMVSQLREARQAPVMA